MISHVLPTIVVSLDLQIVETTTPENVDSSNKLDNIIEEKSTQEDASRRRQIKQLNGLVTIYLVAI